MSTERFFIVGDNKEEGPFDLSALLKKIRSGKLSGDSLVRKEGQTETTAARLQHPLSSFFQRETLNTLHTSRTSNVNAQQLFMSSMKNGWGMVNMELGIIILSSVLVLACLFTGFLLSAKWGTLFAWLTMVSVCFVFQFIIFAMILKLNRGEHLNTTFWQESFLPSLPAIFAFAVLLAFCTIILSALLIIPAIALLSLYIFAPFVLVDNNKKMLAALVDSRKFVTNSGPEFFGAVFGLVAILYIANLTLITLPFTMPLIAAALADLYDNRK